MTQNTHNWKPLGQVRPGSFPELLTRLKTGEALTDLRHGSDYAELRSWLESRRRTVSPMASRAAKALGADVKTRQFVAEAAPGVLVAGIFVYIEGDGL